MTVAQLIEKLTAMPQDATALTTEPCGQWPAEIDSVTLEEGGVMIVGNVCV